MDCDSRTKVCTARANESDEINYHHYFPTAITVRNFCACLEIQTNENPNIYTLSIPLRPLTRKMMIARRLLTYAQLQGVSWVTVEHDHLFTL